ncbi:hypothetical protein U1Q18_001979 [Sarracenia purpurea var. burkii]
MVGFDKKAETLVKRLKVGMSELEIVSIIGMGDLDKTTLYKFNIRAWIYVSQDYSEQEVFIGILSSVEKLTDEMYKWSDERLAEEMRLHLQTKRYLIVMADMWIRGPWDDLKMVFPKNNNRNRILLISRNKEVAVHANPYNLPHFLRFLNNVGSWEPLERVSKGNLPSRAGCSWKANCKGMMWATACDCVHCRTSHEEKRKRVNGRRKWLRVARNSKFIRSIDYPAVLRTVAKKIQSIKNMIDVLYRK